ncbi:MAG TPA: mannosyltransferase family protein [Mycobacteriales bacterium]|nr:mannosyltransferase family protein [Mycobacteriales bacterium]
MRDREALSTWVYSRVAVFVISFASLWMLGDTVSGDVPSYLSGWDRWDAHLFLDLAKYGYRGYHTKTTDIHLEAFFPGEPAAMRLGHLLTGSWVAGALAVSAVAGAFAMVALARLGGLERGTAAGDVVGSRAVLYLVLSPYAVFLAAGYSESLFLAFALWSWLAARRGRWLAAGLLAGGAALVRIDGLFLGAALAVEWLVTARPYRWRTAVPLVAPWLVTAGFFGYLWAVTGDARAWFDAQREGWGRAFTAPWKALHTSWSAAVSPVQGTAYEWSFRAEIAAVFLGLALTILLLVMHRWGEATFVGLQVAALASSAYYLSVARSTLLWFPLWLLLARASVRRPWVHKAYLATAPALMAVAVVTFTSGRWVG